jgi:hypothetical protein
MPATESHLTPEDRFREIATILAAGLLRLRTHPEGPPCIAKSGPGKSPESRRNTLDGGPKSSPHDHAG